MGNHPLFSSQPLCPVRLLLPPPSPPASPWIGAPCWFSLQGQTWQRGEESTQSPDKLSEERQWDKVRREKDHTCMSVHVHAHTHTLIHTHTRLSEAMWKLCDPNIHFFVLWFKVSCPLYQTFKEKEKTQQWINHTATETYCSNIPEEKESHSETETKTQREHGREPGTKRKLKVKRKEQTPLWSFDGTLL